MRAPIGLKIRNYRKMRGLTQSDLAKRANISAPYLNLIEANKRDVGGALVQRLAKHLDVELSELTGDADQRLLDELLEAFSEPLLESSSIGADQVHTLLAHQPEIARALHRLYRAYIDQRSSNFEYANRLKSDPLFAQLLHKMLTQITAVRSTSEILRDVPEIDERVRNEFLQTMHQQSAELSLAARSLISEFEHDATQQRALSPAREVDDLFVDRKNYFENLEAAAADLRLKIDPSGDSFLQTRRIVEALETLCGVEVRYEGPPKNAATGRAREFGYDSESKTLWFRSGVPIATQRFQLARRLALLQEHETLAEETRSSYLTSDAARQAAHGAMASHLASALLFPPDAFFEATINSSYDIDFLCQKYSASFEQVGHRLVSMYAFDSSAIPFGFVRSDPSGYLTKQYPLPGMLMPNTEHACPLWTLYGAFRTPANIVRNAVSYADGARYMFIAKASAKRVTSFAEPPVYSSVMLICDSIHADKTVYGAELDLSKKERDLPVGPTCRLCVRTDCAHRQTGVARTISAPNLPSTPPN